VTNTELKAALQSQKPVILRSARYGELKYKCVNAIRYTLDRTGSIIVQAELLDYNGGSITIASGNEVFLDNVIKSSGAKQATDITKVAESKVKGINVLSLCDGMSCGQIALRELGIAVNKYYASEIDKTAIKVTMDNFPQTIQSGDIRGINEGVINKLPKVDLIMAGFPCRDLSIITRNGGSKNWEDMHNKGEGLNGEHSGLYNEFIRIYRQIRRINPNIKFLVENVASMKADEKKTIDRDLEVSGAIINSALFSAQNRERIYWTNIKQDRTESANQDVIKNILESNVPTKYFDSRRFIPCESATLAGHLDLGSAHDIAKRVYRVDVKSPTLTACRGGNLQKKIYIDGRCRKLTPTEYRRLQTIPDWYKMDVADSHIYNLCGDGWTIDVIKHILKNLTGG